MLGRYVHIIHISLWAMLNLFFQGVCESFKGNSCLESRGSNKTPRGPLWSSRTFNRLNFLVWDGLGMVNFSVDTTVTP